MDHGIPFGGDVSLFDALATVGYPLAAAAAVAAGSTLFDRVSGTQLKRRAVSKRFWGLLALGLMLMLIDRQLGLLDRLVEAVRAGSRTGGWYEDRRPYQALFLVVLLAGGIVATLAMRAAVGRAGRPIAVALVAGAGLALFAAMRAASLHHVDAVLAMRLGGVPLAYLPEYLLLGIVMSAGIVERRIIRRRMAAGRIGPSVVVAGETNTPVPRLAGTRL